MTVKLDKTVAKYIEFRRMEAEMKRRHKEELAPVFAAKEYLEGILLKALNETGQEMARTVAGTCYKTLKTSAQINDVSEFMRFVIGSERWDLLDKKANSPACLALREESGHAPPGVNLDQRWEVGVRVPTAKTTAK